MGRKGPVREYGPFLIAVLLLLAICGPRYAGINLVFAIPLAIGWLAWRGWRSLRSPIQRRILGRKTVVLVIGFAAIAAAHFSYAGTARADAQRIVDALLRFQAREGRFPGDAVEAGINTVELDRKYVRVSWASAGKPSVIYSSTFIPFDVYRFDFATRTWVFHPD